MTIARGEVYFVDLGRPEGHELGHEHPVVVLSINDINRKPLVVVVVPGTSLKEGKPVRPNQVLIHASETNGLTKETLFQCYQIKSLDHSKFHREPSGEFASHEMEQIEKMVMKCLGLLTVIQD